MKHHQSGYAFATAIAVLLALIPFAVVGSHYHTKPKESIVIGSSTKKQILVLSEREALALIAHYPPGEPDAKIVQSMRDIARHTLASQTLLPGIKPKVPALPGSKYLVKIQLDGEWVAQPARYDTFAEALEAAKEYAVPTLVRPAKETERSPEVSVAAPEKRDSHFGGDNYEASLLRDLLARIHGDGGQMLHRVGLDECFEAAEGLVSECRAYALFKEEHKNKLGTNDFRDAYEGAREDLLAWRRRAQRAEATLRSIAEHTTEWLENHNPMAATLLSEKSLTAIIEVMDKNEIDFKQDKYRHIVTGDYYAVEAVGETQTSVPLGDKALVVVYRSDKDGRVWVRPEAEFRQRFAKAGHVTPAKTVKKDEGDEFVEVTPSA